MEIRLIFFNFIINDEIDAFNFFLIKNEIVSFKFIKKKKKKLRNQIFAYK